MAAPTVGTLGVIRGKGPRPTHVGAASGRVSVPNPTHLKMGT